ncbi:MAG: hypothetical protein WD972_00750, partial [Candidatus Andersenbacteria bacterium]
MRRITLIMSSVVVVIMLLLVVFTDTELYLRTQVVPGILDEESEVTGDFSWTPGSDTPPGDYTVQLQATDETGNIATKNVTITVLPAGSGGDTASPTIAISTPTTDTTHSTSATPVTLSGSASDTVGVTSVAWANAANGASGTATGTTTWLASVPLAAGSNVITVTARDQAGNTSTDSITVTYTPGDTIRPAVNITTPTLASTATTAATPFALGGTATDNIGVQQVTWSNVATSGSGIATGTTNWSAAIPLAAGNNVITVTARDQAGNISTDVITVTFTQPSSDTTPPTISINSPTAADTWPTTATPLSVSGVASDNVAVSTVTWSNVTNSSSGTASGTTSWSAAIPLAAGTNAITVRAFDSAGNVAADALSVTFA